MNLQEMRVRGWQVIDDNPDNPVEVSKELMTAWINDAVIDLSEALQVTKSITLIINNGSAWLPDDYLEAIKAYDDTYELKRLFTLHDKTVTDDTTDAAEYFIPNDGTIQVFGKTLRGTFKLHYRAAPDTLVNDADIPELLPRRFHHFVPEVYVKAQYSLKNGRSNTYRAFMSMWEDIRLEVAAAQGVSSFEQEVYW